MCRYMWLPIAFRDNQQISLADSTEIPEASSSQLSQSRSSQEGLSPELEPEDNKSLYATDGGSP